MKNLKFLQEALDSSETPILGMRPTFHPYEGLEDGRGPLSRYRYHPGVSAVDLAHYVQLGGKLDSEGHYGISLEMLEKLLAITDGKGIFEDAVRYMIHEETPRWVNWHMSWSKAVGMAEMATTPTEFCKLCYQTKGFFIQSLTQGKFIYRLSNTEKRALRHHRLSGAEVGEQVAFIVKYRKNPVQWMAPVDAWKALGRQIPYKAQSEEDNHIDVMHPFDYARCIQRPDNPTISIEGNEHYLVEGKWYVEAFGFEALAIPFDGQVRDVGDTVFFIGKYFNCAWDKRFDRHVSSYSYGGEKKSLKALYHELQQALSFRRKKAEEGLSISDAKAAGFCLNGVKGFLQKKMPFLYFLIRNVGEWTEIPSDIFETRYLVEPYVWEGYESYQKAISQ